MDGLGVSSPGSAWTPPGSTPTGRPRFVRRWAVEGHMTGRRPVLSTGRRRARRSAARRFTRPRSAGSIQSAPAFRPAAAIGRAAFSCSPDSLARRVGRARRSRLASSRPSCSFRPSARLLRSEGGQHRHVPWFLTCFAGRKRRVGLVVQRSTTLRRFAMRTCHAMVMYSRNADSRI